MGLRPGLPRASTAPMVSSAPQPAAWWPPGKRVIPVGRGPGGAGLPPGAGGHGPPRHRGKRTGGTDPRRGPWRPGPPGGPDPGRSGRCASPVVWETNPIRMSGNTSYAVMDPSGRWGRGVRHHLRPEWRPGDPGRGPPAPGPRGRGGPGRLLRRTPLHLPPAFLKEARIRVAAEWRPQDLTEVLELSDRGAPLSGRAGHPPGGGRRRLPTPTDGLRTTHAA
jgi:hypothetical protein